MKAIILAAGKGRRLKSLSIPKCLIKIDNKTLLEYSLDNLLKCDIEKVIIVVGYLKDLIKHKIGFDYKGMKIEYVTNSNYEDRGNFYSLQLGLNHDKFERGLIYLDGDLLYDWRIVKKLIDSPHKNAILYGPLEKDSSEEVKVYGIDGIATDIGKKINNKNPLGESVGIFKLIDMFKVEDVMKCVEKKAEHEDFIQKMCDERVMNLVSTEGLLWIEIDFDEDITKAKNEIYPKLRGDYYGNESPK